jgi:hypothetical protein
MARTKGSKNKSKVAPVTEETDQSDDAVVKVVSTKAVTSTGNKALLDQIAKLQADKAALEGKLVQTQQEKDALEAVQAQGSVFGITATERPTGKTVTVKRWSHNKVVGFESGREILRPVFKDVKRETYLYKIDLPPSGDIATKINDVPFYHGAVYEVDIDTLRMLKDLVYRCWDHDRQVHGDKNENAFRRKHVDFNPRNILRGGGQ